MTNLIRNVNEVQGGLTPLQQVEVPLALLANALGQIKQHSPIQAEELFHQYLHCKEYHPLAISQWEQQPQQLPYQVWAGATPSLSLKDFRIGVDLIFNYVPEENIAKMYGCKLSDVKASGQKFSQCMFLNFLPKNLLANLGGKAIEPPKVGQVKSSAVPTTEEEQRDHDLETIKNAIKVTGFQHPEVLFMYLYQNIPGLQGLNLHEALAKIRAIKIHGEVKDGAAARDIQVFICYCIAFRPTAELCQKMWAKPYAKLLEQFNDLNKQFSVISKEDRDYLLTKCSHHPDDKLTVFQHALDRLVNLLTPAVLADGKLLCNPFDFYFAVTKNEPSVTVNGEEVITPSQFSKIKKDHAKLVNIIKDTYFWFALTQALVSGNAAIDNADLKASTKATYKSNLKKLSNEIEELIVKNDKRITQFGVYDFSEVRRLVRPIHECFTDLDRFSKVFNPLNDPELEIHLIYRFCQNTEVTIPEVMPYALRGLVNEIIYGLSLAKNFQPTSNTPYLISPELSKKKFHCMATVN